MNNNLIKKTEGGFTLIEMMVAVSIFIIVAFVVTGTFIVAMDAYRKAQQIRLTIDNVNYAMDTMVLEIREGTKYTWSIGNTSSFTFTNVNGADITYSLCPTGAAICRTIVSTGNASPLTDSRVNIKNLLFNFIQSDGSKPPMLKVNAYGLIITTKSTTDFNLQTIITQRNPDPN